MIILCCQTPAWGTIGIAEWQTPTPGGNMIGNNDSLPSNTGTAIYYPSIYIDGSIIYVKYVHRYGFYEGAIIGEANEGVFWFDETTKSVRYFPSQVQLCETVAAKGLKFYNNLTFFPGSHHYDYDVIRYALYFLVSFLIWLTMHYRLNRTISLPLRIDRTLKNRFFTLQLYSLTVCSNAAFINKQVSDSDSIINGITTDVIIAAIALAVVGIPLWGLS